MRHHRKIYSQLITLFNLCIYQNDLKNHVAEHGLRDSLQDGVTTFFRNEPEKLKIQTDKLTLQKTHFQHDVGNTVLY